MILIADTPSAADEEGTTGRAPGRDLSLMALVRNRWFRIGVPVFSAALAVFYSYLVPESNVLRSQVLAALQPALLLAGFGSGVTLFSIGVFVRKLRAEALTAVDDVRTRLWTTYDAFARSKQPGLRSIAERQLAFLLELGRDDWLENRYEGWSTDIREGLEMIDAPLIRRDAVYRHLVPLEESIHELFMYYIRGVTSDLYVETARTMLLVLCSMVVWNLFAHVLPGGAFADRVVIAGCTAAIALSTVEVLSVFSWVWQDTRSEGEFTRLSDGEGKEDDEGDAAGA